MMTISERVEKVADRYIITGHPVRRLAQHFHVSKFTIYDDLTRKASRMLPYDVVEKINERLESNLRELRTYGKCINLQDYPPDIRADDPDTYGVPKEMMVEEIDFDDVDTIYVEGVGDLSDEELLDLFD